MNKSRSVFLATAAVYAFLVFGTGPNSRAALARAGATLAPQVREGQTGSAAEFEDRGPNPSRQSFLVSQQWIVLSRSKKYKVQCDCPRSSSDAKDPLILVYKWEKPARGADPRGTWSRSESYPKSSPDQDLLSTGSDSKWLITLWRFRGESKGQLAQPVELVGITRSAQGSGASAEIKFSVSYKDKDGWQATVSLSRPLH